MLFFSLSASCFFWKRSRAGRQSSQSHIVCVGGLPGSVTPRPHSERRKIKNVKNPKRGVLDAAEQMESSKPGKSCTTTANRKWSGIRPIRVEKKSCQKLHDTKVMQIFGMSLPCSDTSGAVYALSSVSCRFRA